jgi:RimJ/RimL family protein N-acetyltransferase
MSTLTTARLRLEPVNETHLEGLYALNSLPEVMRYITGKPDTREDTAAMIERIKQRWIEFGFSWWAFVEIESGAVIGMGCVQHLARDAANPLEIGWRLHPSYWHQGYASEAAKRMAAFAFDELQAPLLCAVCHHENKASATVMQRLGMAYQGEERWYDMDCSVYRITRDEWSLHSSR